MQLPVINMLFTVIFRQTLTINITFNLSSPNDTFKHSLIDWITTTDCVALGHDQFLKFVRPSKI